MTTTEMERRYCVCGSAYAAPKDAAGLWAIWDDIHTRPGHAPTDARTCSRARRALDRGETAGVKS